ncbi:hypothetical protein AMECASPLE_033941 [Ameca splendens]|uniref:Uncharacterized protein n=1 Tax=Ameca splendens TaxID=208324 RepID=A0ABV0Z5M0_9TELE
MGLNSQKKCRQDPVTATSRRTQHEQKTLPASPTNLPETLEEKAACAACGGQNHLQLRSQQSQGSQQQEERGTNKHKSTPAFINLRARRKKGLGSRCHVTI